MATRFDRLSNFRLATTLRRIKSCSCKLIFTGQTSVHDAHKLHAKGNVEYCAGSRAGCKIEPIGPGIVEW